MNVASAPSTNPMTSMGDLTPQQRMALALMQSGQNDLSNVNQQGQMSPMQGLSSMGSQLLAAQMMKNANQQPSQLGNSVPQSFLNNANGSSDPIAALNATMGWTPSTN